MKHIKSFNQLNDRSYYTDYEELVDLFKQQFLEKYPTREDFDTAFTKFYWSKECRRGLGSFSEEDIIRMMIKKEWEEIDPQNESGWREAIKKNRYLISLRNALPY